MSKRSKKILRISVISLFVLLIIFVGIIWYVAHNLERIVERALVEEVRKSTNGLYTLQIGKLKINPTNGVARINDINFLIDSSKLYQLEVRGEKPHFTTNVSAKFVEIDIDSPLLKLRKGRMLDISQVSIIEPRIELNSSNADNKKRQSEKQQKQNIKLPFFSSAIIEEIELINGSIYYSSPDTTAYAAENFSLSISNFRVNSTINIANPLTHIGNATLEVNNIQHFLLDSALLFQVKKLSANLKDSSLYVDSLTISPQYEKYEFARKTPNHNDIIKLSIADIKMSGVSYNQLIEENILAIANIAVDSLYFWSFKNKQIPPIIPKEKPLFHQIVQRIPIPTAISKISITNSNAGYEELALNGKTPGEINFTNIHAEVDGLTNIVTDKDQLYTIKGRAKVFDKGAIDATFRFPIDSLNDYFEVSGHLGKMDLTAINPMVTPLASVEIKSGNVQSMDFSISGNSRTAKTNMTFLYSNLKVDLLNSKKENHPERKFLSGVINTLLIKSNNPSDNKEPRKIANAISKRDRFLSNFNYWWRGIREGMIQSIGIP